MGDDTSPGRHYSHDAKTMGSSAVIASVLGSLLVVGIVLVVTNSNDVNAPAEALQTELTTVRLGIVLTLTLNIAKMEYRGSRGSVVTQTLTHHLPRLTGVRHQMAPPPAPSTRGSTKHS